MTEKTITVETEKDTQRLNFISNHKINIICGKNKRWSVHTGLPSHEYETYKTLREAIDAAIKYTMGM